MAWTLQKLSKPGWYWYREPGLNLDKPMPVWVYQSGQVVYVTLCGAHGDLEERGVNELNGEWAGPITPPAVFEERESNP